MHIEYLLRLVVNKNRESPGSIREVERWRAQAQGLGGQLDSLEVWLSGLRGVDSSEVLIAFM